MNTRLFTFSGGKTGDWRITQIETIVGEPLPDAERLTIFASSLVEGPEGTNWRLRGIRSNERYITQPEKDQLVAIQPKLNRPEATCAALIPIRKTADWWALPQDERRRIFEESSHHVKVGLMYLPAVARRLHHCRDLSENEPFDFLTWFEFAPEHTPAFNEMVAVLRATEEWAYVDRECDIRLVRDVEPSPDGITISL
ncbi:MAG TPA: chlorite dismutase family protein [Acidobacteriota bacterium]|nr:chlorite dismutase family protein [Acidobacteriota bacterium]HNG93231.1 chlorite dismutase family protein [Acidobacteriota bacterium]